MCICRALTAVDAPLFASFDWALFETWHNGKLFEKNPQVNERNNLQIALFNCLHYFVIFAIEARGPSFPSSFLAKLGFTPVLGSYQEFLKFTTRPWGGLPWNTLLLFWCFCFCLCQTSGSQSMLRGPLVVRDKSWSGSQIPILFI